jgi:hypothetical protein
VDDDDDDQGQKYRGLSRDEFIPNHILIFAVLQSIQAKERI